MVTNPNLVIFGFMGSGKSAAGRIAARMLNRTFIDMDTELESNTGKTVSQIFAEDGEPAFRLLEYNLATQLAKRNNLVISTGGGAVLDERNIKNLGSTGFLVCLTAHEHELVRRVVRGRHRPLLNEDNIEEKIHNLIQVRKKHYDTIPNQVDTTRMSPHDVASAIVRLFTNALK